VKYWSKVKRAKYSEKKKGSPYSITERRVPELIPVLGSQPAGDVTHKPGGRLPLLSARPVKNWVVRAATSFAAWWTEAQWVWTVCLRLLPDTPKASRLRSEPRPFCAWVQHANHSATEQRKVQCTFCVSVCQHWLVSVHCVQFSVTVTKSFVDYVKSRPIIVDVFGHAQLSVSESNCVTAPAKWAIVHLPDYAVFSHSSMTCHTQARWPLDWKCRGILQLSGTYQGSARENMLVVRENCLLLTWSLELCQCLADCRLALAVLRILLFVRSLQTVLQ